jgi:prephenate dehydratase
VGYAGEPGAFGEQAAQSLSAGAEPVPLPSFAEVARAVLQGEVDAGVVPIENALAGPVQEGIAAVIETRAPVRGEVRVRVEHLLLGVPGTRLEDVREVTSHPQALAQCARFLDAHGLTRIPDVNTAVAARRVAETKSRTRAAIASAAAAKRLGLSVLAREIADASENVTRFLVLGDGRDRGSLAIAIAPESAGVPKGARVIGAAGSWRLFERPSDAPEGAILLGRI